MKRLGILLSGRGSNFQAIADNVQRGSLDAEIAVVISNRPQAAGIEAAQTRGLKTLVLPCQGIAREQYDGMVVAELQRHNVDLVCLAGFMRLLSVEFCQAFALQALNVHPSLLPAFPGLHAQRQALDYGAKISGCTVHFVDQQLDAGPIVMQAAVPVRDDDTEDSLAARILAEEHRIYSEAITLVLSERWKIVGRRVIAPGDFT